MLINHKELNKIMKSLSPEEQQLVQSAIAALSDLAALNNTGENESAPEMPGVDEEKVASLIKRLMAKEEKEKEEMQMAKKENNGPTADDSGEERLKSETSVNNDNYSEVGKLLKTIVNLNAQKNQENNLASIIRKELNPLIDKINQQEQAIVNILDGFGIAEKIEKNITANNTIQKNMNNLPIQAPDQTAVLTEIYTFLKSQNEKNKINKQYEGMTGLEKSHNQMMEAIPFLFSENLKKDMEKANGNL